MIKRHTKFATQLGVANAGDAAIHRHDHLLASLGKFSDRVFVQAVTIFQSIRHIVTHVTAEQPNTVDQDRCARHSIGVVITINHDRRFGCDCVAEQSGCLGDPRQQLGIAKTGQFRIEKPSGIFGGIDAATDKQLCNNSGKACGGDQLLNTSPIVGHDPPLSLHP